MASGQWNLKVKITQLDRETINGKSKWEVGDTVTVSIEPHATVNMLKQRIQLIVSAHNKYQQIFFGEGTPAIDDIAKLSDIEGLTDCSVVTVNIKVSPEPELPPVVLSDDEGLCENEDAALPEMPSTELCNKELDDADMDKQCELKQQAQDALEDGNLDVAVAKFTEVMMLGGVSAMMAAKRAEMLLKEKRYKAAEADATLALSLNPDSAKAYRVRGKARRFTGDYEGSSSDLAQAQEIDYDDGVVELHSYVQKRLVKMKLKVKQDMKAAAVAAAAA